MTPNLRWNTLNIILCVEILVHCLQHTLHIRTCAPFTVSSYQPLTTVEYAFRWKVTSSSLRLERVFILANLQDVDNIYDSRNLFWSILSAARLNLSWLELAGSLDLQGCTLSVHDQSLAGKAQLRVMNWRFCVIDRGFKIWILGTKFQHWRRLWKSRWRIAYPSECRSSYGAGIAGLWIPWKYSTMGFQILFALIQRFDWEFQILSKI